MGLHERLGAASLVHQLEVGVVRIVVEAIDGGLSSEEGKGARALDPLVWLGGFTPEVWETPEWEDPQDAFDAMSDTEFQAMFLADMAQLGLGGMEGEGEGEG